MLTAFKTCDQSGEGNVLKLVGAIKYRTSSMSLRVWGRDFFHFYSNVHELNSSQYLSIQSSHSLNKLRISETEGQLSSLSKALCTKGDIL